MSIRRGGPADAPQIGQVFDAAVRDGWAYLGALAREPMFSPGEWDKLIEDHAPPNILLVAVDTNDDVIGFTAAHPHDCEMFLLFVQPEQARRGVGRQLLDVARDALRAAGCHQVFLYAHEQNARALAVYEAAGYQRDGSYRESIFRGVHIREPRLVKTL